MTPLETGTTIDAYRVVGTLGSGGMGHVYRVEHTLTRRQEAMKVLAGGRFSAGEQAQRFLREIQLQASLNHPNIAFVHHAFWRNDDLVMIMELVEGATLRNLLQVGLIPLDVALNYTRQLLSALQYAHEHGVVHRDVTPANILITPGGTVKLTDFGLAKTPGDMRLTQTGAVMGSLYYMSPEQVRGRANVDGRTDIYSMGVLLYEMAAGHKPFERDDPFSLMQAHVQEKPLPLVRADGDIPPALNEIVLTALAKEPEQRFSSAGSFLAALEKLPKIAPATRTRPWTRARTLRYAAGALICASMLIGVEPLQPPPPEKPKPTELAQAELPAQPKTQRKPGAESSRRRSWLSKAFSKVRHPRRGTSEPER